MAEHPGVRCSGALGGERAGHSRRPRGGPGAAADGRRYSAAEDVVLDQPWVLISIGGVLGANARYLVGVWAARRIGTSFPYGTLIANVSGSIMLGFLTIFAARLAAVGPERRLAAGVGFCGAYTTFSTFAFESVTLTRHGDY